MRAYEEEYEGYLDDDYDYEALPAEEAQTADAFEEAPAAEGFWDDSLEEAETDFLDDDFEEAIVGAAILEAGGAAAENAQGATAAEDLPLDEGAAYAAEALALEEEATAEAEEEEEEEKAGFFAFFAKMSAWDKIIAASAAMLLILFVCIGLLLFHTLRGTQTVDFSDIGTNLASLDFIGEEGIRGLTQTKLALLSAAEEPEEVIEVVAEEEEETSYDELDYVISVTVSMSSTSVLKDLKLKFTNKSTGKLISNVPFTVNVTTPSGKTTQWTDSDMDGIIYYKDIEGGTYTITFEPFTDSKYSSYGLPDQTYTVTVKSQLDYAVVDVSDEVKDESEIDVATEDTEINDTVVESSLTDTVTWVASTVTAGGYTEISKSTITDPSTLLVSALFKRTTSTVSGGDAQDDVDDTDEGTEGDDDDTGDEETTDPVTMGLSASAATVYTTVAYSLTANIVNSTQSSPTVSAVSSDTTVATVSVSGTTISVIGATAGSATITVSYTENGETLTEKCVVTVKTHPSEDTTTLLTDKSGNQVYVLENAAYREAYYADYYTASNFYIMNDIKYTGWQTIDGSVYFFDSNGNKVTGEQVIQGAKYTFASDGSLVTGDGIYGIDVSKWNGTIDWTAVKNSGISFVIIRCGYRGSTQGALVEDTQFKTNITGATAAGLKVGVYFFTQAIDEVEAVYEASFVIDLIKNYKISYPVFLDVESSGGRGDAISKSTRTAVCLAFCKTISASGYTAGIYANKNWLEEKLDPSQLSAYKIWLAQYAATPTYSGRYDLWQYKATGSVSGISGNVDLNISYLGY